MRLTCCNLWLASVLSLGLGCGATTSLDASHYDQSCQVAADCTAVFVGDQCKCSCDSAAINVRDQARYDADRAAITCLSKNVCGPCQAVTAACSAGKCVVVK